MGYSEKTQNQLWSKTNLVCSPAEPEALPGPHSPLSGLSFGEEVLRMLGQKKLQTLNIIDIKNIHFIFNL